MTGEIQYHAGGDLVEIRAPRMTLVFTKREWVRGLRRGRSIVRARRAGSERPPSRNIPDGRESKRKIIVG
jgi:hypothetical protein